MKNWQQIKELKCISKLFYKTTGPIYLLVVLREMPVIVTKAIYIYIFFK